MQNPLEKLKILVTQKRETNSELFTMYGLQTEFEYD